MERKFFIDKRLYIDISSIPGANYGVFSDSLIPKDTIIEISHILKISKLTRDLSIYTNNNTLYDYIWGSNDGSVLALGYGSMYNHSDVPTVEASVKTDCIEFKTLTDISPNEELYVSYGINWMKVHHNIPTLHETP